MRIVLLGDGRWAANTVPALLAAGHEVAAVVGRINPSDDSLSRCASELNLQFWQPARTNDAEFGRSIKHLQADLGISISYNQILKRPLLDSTTRGFINFHAGQLPRYRGRNVINWAIINGESEIGLTAHFIDEGIDSGDIVLQRTLPIQWTDGYGDVLSRVVDAFPSFVVEAVQGIEDGTLNPAPQSHAESTYVCGRECGDEWLDWGDSSVHIYNKIRAITRPGPGARTFLRHQPVIIWRAEYDPAWPKYVATPGQVVGRNGEGAVIKTGDSTLLIKEIQAESGEPQVAAWPVGTRLGLNLWEEINHQRFRIKELEEQLSTLRKAYDERFPH